MKVPPSPPSWHDILQNLQDPKRLSGIMELAKSQKSRDDYLHWDKLRHYPVTNGYSSEEWWLSLKLQRLTLLKPIDLKDTTGVPFQFCIPDVVMQYLHEIDVKAGGTLGVPEPITNPQSRNQYLVRSLMEEAITSSQLEGAATTREVAKEMIRSGRSPKNSDEQMIMNNYVTMQRITKLTNEPLTTELVLEIHRLVTDKTLNDRTASGRFRSPDEIRVVGDDYGEVFHTPPLAEELPGRMRLMCDFANSTTPTFFVPPVLRAIILHFWLAYDHPFVDGNGRTARALFYWSMLKEGCWLLEYISISSVLKKAPVKYGRSFLYTETDDNDLTYFIVAQMKVIREAIEALHAYIDRKSKEIQDLELHLRGLDTLNYRQINLIRHALKHPHQAYTFESHRGSNNVSYQTARTDILDLVQRNLLYQKKRGHRMTFYAQTDLPDRLRLLEVQGPTPTPAS